MKHRYLKNVVTLFIDSDKCIGCGICVEVCPHGVLLLIEGKASILDKDSCMECSGCSTNCITNAVNVQPGVGCANAILKDSVSVKKPDSENKECC